MNQSDAPLVYLIGSLRNPNITALANSIEAAMPVRVFDDWQCAGEHADDAWRDHEKARGHDYITSLARPAAKHVFSFDKKWIARRRSPRGPSGRLPYSAPAWTMPT